MSTLDGYRLDTLLYEGPRTRVHRGRRRADDLPVVVKVLRVEAATGRTLAAFERAYAIGRELRGCAGLIEHLDLVRDESGLALITEDIGAVGLHELIQPGGLELEAFLRIGVALCGALAELHAARVIHKDLKPHNVVLQPEDGLLKIIDLGIASRLPRESPTLVTPQRLEGSLAYIAPEQTGRMNRGVDARADLYALGVSLYQLLSGRLPFDPADPLELIHCHIARTPPDLATLDSRIPPVLARIVAKLLAKTAEERYSSAAALQRDLQRCLADLTPAGRIPEFPIAADDLPTELRLPERLYGREEQLARLMAAFERADVGGRELLLVAGYAGVGKSSLIQELRRPLAARRARFCAGKFEQFRRDQPYAAVLAALRDLVQQSLTESPARLERLISALREALGDNVAVLGDLLPELTLLLGELPAPSRLAPREARNRFHLCVQRFLRVYARPEQPLCVFLDDLQWADLASLELLEALLSDARSGHLLLVGAYRDNELGPGHPLRESIQRLRADPETEGRVQRLDLAPLEPEVVRRLLADTLAQEPAAVEALAARLHAKSGGNPFFLGQLLEALHRRGLLRFEAERGAWAWDLAGLEAVGITDNVVELMRGKLAQLPDATRELLELAACIGHGFDLDILARAAQLERRQAASRLQPALLEQLVLPLDAAYKYAELSSEAPDQTLDTPRYRFLHDRVHQAAHQLLPEPARRALHLRVGRLLWGDRSPAQLGDELIEVAEHLVAGAEEVVDPVERIRLAELCLAAGTRAQAALAFANARRFLGTGLSLLPPDAWAAQPALGLALHTQAARVDYALEDFAALETRCAQVLPRVSAPLDKVPFWRSQIRAQVAQNRPAQAVDLTVAALHELGVHLPRRPGRLQVVVGLLRTKLALAGRDPAELAQAPPMRDPRVLAAMDILVSCSTSAYWVAPNLVALVAFHMVRLALREGSSALAAYGYALYGLVLSGALQDPAGGYAFGQLSCALLERHEESEHHARAGLLFDVFIRHWKEPYAALPGALLRNRDLALEHGDVEHATYCGAASLTGYVLAGRPLDGLLPRYRDIVREIRASQQAQTIPFVNAWLQLAARLREDELGQGGLSGEHLDAAVALDELERLENYNARFHVALTDGYLALLQRESARALQRCEQAAIHREAVLGQSVVPVHAFLWALSLCGAIAAEPGRQRARRRRLEQLRRDLRSWARHAPGNLAHKLALIDAERHRLRGEESAALPAYRRAIAGAEAGGFLPEAALAYELLGEHYQALACPELAEGFLAQAYARYHQWGAPAKCAQLVARHGEGVRPIRGLLAAATREPAAIEREVTHTTTGTSQGVQLDLHGALRAARAISAELELGRLLETLLRVLLETAGARRALLVREGLDGPVVAGEGRVEEQRVHIEREARPLEAVECPRTLIRYVRRTRQEVILADAAQEGLFRADPYVARRGTRSILCLPLVHQGQLSTLLYLENELVAGTFSPARLELLRVLLAQAAISIDNAALYEDLELRVTERTRELREALEALQTLQEQIITQEKLASLGALTAGLAHQLQNPLNFVTNFAELSRELADELVAELEGPAPAAPAEARAALCDDLRDLRENLRRVEKHSRRTDEVVRGMLAHARGGGGERGPTDLAALLDRELELACSGWRTRVPGFQLISEREHDPELGEIQAIPQALGQAFANLLDNACHALHERAQAEAGFQPRLRISTHARGEWVEARIRDNGPGIPAELQREVLSPFVTTKPAGEGTGLGLSICFDVVTKLHGGDLQLDSQLGSHTELRILLPRDGLPAADAGSNAAASREGPHWFTTTRRFQRVQESGL